MGRVLRRDDAEIVEVVKDILCEKEKSWLEFI